ncbi:MAG: MATE family efflux transporter [Lachnospiraceae bacterium]|nr:MATE family efflux transporter [Lachnospiraceae bacterium]MBP3506005.1 MATE family efflux transporter [Lachnospiraceae bacterium]
MKDLTKGNIIRLLIAFSVPLLIGNIFQQLYNIVDTKVVGEILGEDALAAIGASSPIFNLIVGALNGLGNGFGIVVAKFYGAKDMKRMRQAVANAICLCLGITVLVTVISLFLIRPLLVLLNTPEDIFERCTGYIRVIIMFMIFTAAYNLCAAILRALGDTIRPLIFLIMATAINVGLDILFVGVLRMDVQGAAYATVIAQAISFVCCIIYIIKKCPELHLKQEDFSFDIKVIGELMGQGLAMAFMLCFVSIGTLILQGAINKFGTGIISAHTIARKISEIFMLPFSTLGVAAATFTGQNYGAGRYDRIRTGIRDAILISWIWAVFVIATVYLFAPFLIRLISGATTPEIVETAQRYLRFDTPFYFVLGILIILRNAMQGLGRKIVPMISSGIELLGKLIVAWILAERMGYFGIIISEPATWILCTILLCITFFSDARIRKTVS